MMAWKRGTKPPRWHARRGEVCLIDLDKERPALVISSDSLNAHSLDVCIVPISSAEHKSFSLRPKLMAGEAGLKYDSWVKCDQPTSVEKNHRSSMVSAHFADSSPPGVGKAQFVWRSAGNVFSDAMLSSS